MRRVYLESPYAGDVASNIAYAHECMRDCLVRGEAPFASHLLYTQVLDDTVPSQRETGISSGFTWASAADATVVYLDRGISRGMAQGIIAAHAEGRPVELRWLYHNVMRTPENP